jgi:hypothetical protein
VEAGFVRLGLKVGEELIVTLRKEP